MSLGTPFTECLSSYLYRLAESHHLRPWQLYTHLLMPLIEDEEYLLLIDTNKTSIKQTFLSKKTTASNLSVINGLKYITQAIVSAIEQLTLRDDLRFLTLVSWFYLFNSYYSPLKHFCAWCPHCYQVWLELEEVVYIPLLWLFKDIKFCPLHQIRLETICPDCHQTMLNFCPPGYCSHCGAWLGQKHPPLNLADYFPSPEKLQIYQQKLTCKKELIMIAPSINKPPQMKDVYMYLHEYCSHLDEQDLNVLSDSFWLNRDLLTSPKKCQYFYHFSTSFDFLDDVFRYLNISPRQLFL